MSIRVADYISKWLVAAGVTDAFMVTGGGAMHLNDAFGNTTGLAVTPCHHEQACAMAADAYGRLTGRPALVNVTAGPGGTNTLTGVFGAWTDSIPVIFVSGQVKRETLLRNADLPLRQLGDQEIDIVGMVAGITKYAVVLDDPELVRYHLERAFHEATTGRPGPVWLDVPIDVQAAQVDEGGLQGFYPPDLPAVATASLEADIRGLFSALAMAERPVILAGGGIRASGCYEDFLDLIEVLGVPVVTGWNAHDLLWDGHPLNAGRPGTVGTRGGNFVVQNADLVLVLGSRLNIRQIGYAWALWARNAQIFMVDVDAAELSKPTLAIDHAIEADLRDFFRAVRKQIADQPYVDRAAWLEWCQERNRRHPVILDEYHRPGLVNPYLFVSQLTEALDEGEVIVTGDGTACVVTFQAAIIKAGQRLFTNSGAASMGYDLPAAIGAAVALGESKRVICLAGDGSIMMNLQELATIRGHHLNVKIVVLNNQGYHSIRQTQNNYFPNREVGCGPGSGLWFPSFSSLARAFEIGYSCIKDNGDIAAGLRPLLDDSGPHLLEVFLDLNQDFSPKASSRILPDGRMTSAPLEDMAPFLGRAELATNMLVPVLDS